MLSADGFACSWSKGFYSSGCRVQQGWPVVWRGETSGSGCHGVGFVDAVQQRSELRGLSCELSDTGWFFHWQCGGWQLPGSRRLGSWCARQFCRGRGTCGRTQCRFGCDVG